MDELRAQLAALDADQVRLLLSASGHDALLTDPQRHEQEGHEAAVDVAALKAQGNALFKQGQFHQAVRVYTQCMEASSGAEADATLFSNRAMAFLKLEKYDRVVADCSSAIRIAPSIKPYLRRAAAHIALRDATLAVQDLDAALSFEPANREAQRLLDQIVADGDVDRTSRVRAALLIAFQNGWRTMAVKGNPAPPGLNGHVLFTVPDDPQQRVFLYGGRAVRDQKSSIYIMDEHDYSWDLVSTTGAMPTPRAWHSATALGPTTLAIYGGVSASAEDPAVHVLEAMSSPSGVTMKRLDTVSEASTSTELLARSGHASINIIDDDDNHRVLMFGGRTKRGVTNEVWTMYMKKAVVTKERILRAPEVVDTAWPSPRDGHSMVAWTDPHGKKFAVVFGGNGQQTEEKMNDVWLFDVAGREWTQVVCSGDVPTPRSYHSAHVVDHFMIIIGGRTVDAEEGAVYVLDLAGGDRVQWFRVVFPKDKVLAPRAWHASIVRSHRDEIYLLGGGTFHGPSREAAVLDLAKFREIIKRLCQ